jgi:undecaprenyl-diphosphatase
MTWAFVSFLNDIDYALFHAINGFCGQSSAVDHIVSGLESYQVKGLAFMGTFGVLWFQRTKDQARQRETLVLILLAIVISLVVARALAGLLPFRTRPMFASDFGYRAPLFQLGATFEDWSSFPSDTAAFVFVLAAGFWTLSRWWGLAWVCFATLAMSARIFFGLHYPGDIIAGAAIGIGVMIAIDNEFTRARIASPILTVAQQTPAVFYGLLFPVMYEVSTLFAFTRSMRHAILHLFVGFG